MISGILHTTLNKINEAARKLQAYDINIEFEEDDTCPVGNDCWTFMDDGRGLKTTTQKC